MVGPTRVHPARDELDDIATELAAQPYLRVSEEGQYVFVDPTLPPRPGVSPLPAIRPARRPPGTPRREVLIAWCAAALMVALSWIIVLVLFVITSMLLLLT